MAPTTRKDNHPGGNWGHYQLQGLQYNLSVVLSRSFTPSKAAIAVRSGKTAFNNGKVAPPERLTRSRPLHPSVGDELLPMRIHAHVPHTETTLGRRIDPEYSNPRDPLAASLFPRADLKLNSDPVPTAAPDSNPPLYSAIRRASILPLNVPIPSSTPPLSQPHSEPRMPDGEIAFIVAVVLSSVIVGLAVMIIVKSIRKKTHGINLFSIFGGWWWARKEKKNVAMRMSIAKHGVCVRVECDDATWGTPTRMKEMKNHVMRNSVPACGLQNAGIFIDPTPTPPVPSSPPSLVPSSLMLSQKRPISISLPTATEATKRYNFPTIQASSIALATIQEEFEERLQDEEADIALALDIALRGHSSLDNMRIPTSSEFCCSSSITQGEDDEIATTLSLQAAMASIGRRACSAGVRNRMRQGSDASASSQATDTTEGTEGFSSGSSSRSSMTSIATMETDFDEDGEGEEEVYEVRRAQAQSVEIKKGVLVTWRSSKSTQDNKQIIEAPNVVISEPMSTSCSLIDDHSEAASSDASPSSMYTTEGDGSDDGLLHAPVPSLMVTGPSITSIFTLDSSISSISVDLNDFPYPPSLVDPSLPKLIHRGIPSPPVPLWDNHSMDSESTNEQKRSTVEQFIMMYGNV